MRLVFILAILSAPSAAHAADPVPIPGLKDVQERHVAAVAKAKKDHDAAVKEATEALVASLKEIQVERTKAGDLDGAVKLRDLVREVTTGLEKTTEAPGLQIIAASFGYYDAWQDVSQPTRKLVRNGELRLKTAADVHDGYADLSPGQHKTLIIVYRAGNTVRLATFGDNKPVVISAKK